MASLLDLLFHRESDEPEPKVRRRRPGEQRTVVVADDEDGMREVMSRVARREGHRVVEIADGLALSTYLKAAFRGQTDSPPPDLLISDIHMPGIDGLEALERAPEVTWQLPVILVTGLPSSQVEDRSRGVGAVELIYKPFSMERLAEAIRRLLPPESMPPGPPPKADEE